MTTAARVHCPLLRHLLLPLRHQLRLLPLAYGDLLINESGSSLLLKSILNLLGLELYLRCLHSVAILVLGGLAPLNGVRILRLFVEFQLHEGIGVGLELADHVLL